MTKKRLQLTLDTKDIRKIKIAALIEDTTPAALVLDLLDYAEATGRLSKVARIRTMRELSDVQTHLL